MQRKEHTWGMVTYTKHVVHLKHHLASHTSHTKRSSIAKIVHHLASHTIIPRTGGLKDHNFLTSRVNRSIYFIFGILTLRASDWHINESILRGSKGGGGPGGVGELWGVSPEFY